MKTGKNPNAGIAALRKVAPGAVKSMGYKKGGKLKGKKSKYSYMKSGGIIEQFD